MVRIAARRAESLHVIVNENRLVGNDIRVFGIDFECRENTGWRIVALGFGGFATDEVVRLFETDKTVHACFGGGVVW